jgi:hypothetical protein
MSSSSARRRRRRRGRIAGLFVPPPTLDQPVDGRWTGGARRADRRLSARQGSRKRLADLVCRPRLGPKVVVDVDVVLA